MKQTITNNTNILQTYYDEFSPPHRVQPGESVEISTDNTYKGFESLTMLQTTVSGILYVGYAKSGTLESQAGWAIMAVVVATGAKAWAGGKFAFESVWNDRLTFTYS